jgi:DNA-binding response OmpR family regulator
MYEQRLLAIEDEQEVADLIRSVALQAGFNAHIVTKAADIADAYRQFRPHVIVLDIMMPSMDGFDVINYLYAQRAQAPLVILSGSSDYRMMAEKIAEARGMTVAANLSKPFRIHELRLALQEIREHITFEPSYSSVSSSSQSGTI